MNKSKPLIGNGGIAMTQEERLIYQQGIDAALGAMRELRWTFPEKVFAPVPDLIWPALGEWLKSQGLTLDALSANYHRQAIDIAIEKIEEEKEYEPF